MNENVLIAINNEINELYHSGRKGQKPGVFGASGATRFQTNAVYAKYTPNPNERKSLKDRIGEASAKRKAKNDAAYEISKKTADIRQKHPNTSNENAFYTILCLAYMPDKIR